MYSNDEMKSWTEEQWYAYFHAGRVAASDMMDARANGHVWLRDDEGLVETLFWGNHHDGPKCVNCGQEFCRNCYDEFPPCGVQAPSHDDRKVARDLGDVLIKRLQGATVSDVLKSKRR